jgi:hypothetical protein
MSSRQSIEVTKENAKDLGEDAGLLYKSRDLIWILLECISTKFAFHQPDEN